MRGFEVYRKRSRLGANRALIKLGTRGDMTLNPMAVKALRDPTHVVLLFDRSGKRIALKPTDDGDENGFSLTGPGPSKVLNTRSFSHYYKLEPYFDIPYGARYEDGLLVIDLDERGS